MNWKVMIIAGVTILSVSIGMFFLFGQEYRYLEIPVLLTITISLMIKILKYSKKQKKEFVAKKSGKELNKTDIEHLKYKEFHRTMNWIIIEFILIYFVVAIIGICLKLY